jgi:hypothetical protein
LLLATPSRHVVAGVDGSLRDGGTSAICPLNSFNRSTSKHFLSAFQFSIVNGDFDLAAMMPALRRLPI